LSGLTRRLRPAAPPPQRARRVQDVRVQGRRVDGPQAHRPAPAV